MTTTDLLLGGAIALVVLRQLRSTFLEHRHADRPTTTGRDLARVAAGAASGTALGPVGAALSGHLSGGTPGTTWGARVGWVVSLVARTAFLVWLYDVTDGAAFSPFGFASDLVGGPVRHPVLVALGLTEVVARVGAIAVRAVRGDRADSDADLRHTPAVPVEPHH